MNNLPRYRDVLSLQAPGWEHPRECITSSVLEAGFRAVPPGNPSGSAAAPVPGCGSGPGKSPGVLQLKVETLPVGTVLPSISWAHLGPGALHFFWRTRERKSISWC